MCIMTDICKKVLCYIQNTFCISTRTTIMSGFYTSEELVAAKYVLFRVVEKLLSDNKHHAFDLPEFWK